VAFTKTVTSILSNLREYQRKLTILANLSRQEFLRDFTNVESAKHLLQVSIQCCLDIANHIIATDGYRTPQDSYDSMVVLNEVAILPNEFMPSLRQMVSFRNRMVHLYWEIDDAFVYDILQNNLDDFTTYITYVTEYLAQSSDSD